MDLTTKRCVPCEVGGAPLGLADIQRYRAALTTDWEVIDSKMIRREYKFKSFKEAVEFINSVAKLADAEGHHPDLHLHYNRVIVELWTHAVGGLSENDFIVARKIEALVA